MTEYITIGILVYACIFYRVAYCLANSQKGYMSGHPVASFVDKAKKPGIGEFFGALIWFIPLVLGWPVVLLYYLIKTLFFKKTIKS